MQKIENLEQGDFLGVKGNAVVCSTVEAIK